MSRLYVQLGRAGDILNILPFLWHEAQSGERPRLMVSRDYFSLLEAVDYVDPIRFDGPAWQIAEACYQAEALDKDYICTQVNGETYSVATLVYGRAKLQNAVTTSFQKEQWRVAGKLNLWDECLPLNLLRSPEREDVLIKKHWPATSARKLILVAADGISSPFPYKELLVYLAKSTGAHVLDLSTAIAERLVDLLGLYEKADCLIATDSAPLHLAWAMPDLPVLALTNDRPLLWNGSSWRPNHHWYCRYHDFPERAVEMVRAIRSASRAPLPEGQRTIHVWNAYEKGAVPQFNGANWIYMPIYLGACGRDSKMVLQDDRRLPLLTDALRMGLQRARPGDLVCLTRPDTIAHIDLDLPKDRPAFAYRMNRHKYEDTFAPIVDLFSAPKEWWQARLHQIPTLVLGSDYYWSHALWALFQQDHALDLTGSVHRDGKEKGLVPVKDPFPPRVKANINGATSFLQSLHVTSRYPKVSEQIATLPFDRKALNGFAYNPSIIEYRGTRLMAYRYHPGPGPETKIAISELDPNYQPLGNLTLNLEGSSNEDPKLFTLAGNLCMSWVTSTLPAPEPKAVVRYGWLERNMVQSAVQPNIGKNDFSSIEKNWVFWEHDGSLYTLYQCLPQQIISPLAPIAGPRWAYGQIKGGTGPLHFGENWIRFFHSTLDNEFGQYRRRYFLGAQVMKPRPPFETVAVSRKPIAYGSEIDDLKVKERPHHWKANVIFPGGGITKRDGWIVSLGVNDCECVLAFITEKELNL